MLENTKNSICWLPAALKVNVKVAQSRLTLCKPMELSRAEYWSAQSFPSPGDLPNPRIESRSPAVQVDSLPVEPSSILEWAAYRFSQRIFPTQELNQGLLHCRQILYQLSHKGSPGEENQLLWSLPNLGFNLILFDSKLQLQCLRAEKINDNNANFTNLISNGKYIVYGVYGNSLYQLCNLQQ